MEPLVQYSVASCHASTNIHAYAVCVPAHMHVIITIYILVDKVLR